MNRDGTTTTRPKQGTPQGGVISPLLANIYLHWFEKAFHRPDGPATWAKAKIVRYADDFVVMARYVGDRLTTWMESTTRRPLPLDHQSEEDAHGQTERTGASLDFLGFTFRYDRDLRGRGAQVFERVSIAESRWPACGIACVS